ncbi:hypothetical protein LOTGIDRAFT_161151 [Lottia gigantea]|uniref:LRRCT domain-containing protein n=1 Tax=Lottia gigantea TaxID=225164 RepID=V4BZ94_LOTGI|nr:hypothetical protein LOTGIDRAFT_161151 [Lottia gigantea]ESO94459.1 hypothetical protein LOTGIDRAFT_161151 [Lottia gigantea]
MSVISVIFVIITLLCGVQACPTRCLCFRTTVRCMFLQLESIPQVKPETTILDLRFNKIKSIPNGTFRSLNRLTTLLLNNNEIQELGEHSFTGLNEIKYIYLYKNKIKTIRENTFKSTKKLEQLYLHNNVIKRLPKGIFSGLTSLRRLRLDSNALVCDCGIMWLAKMLKEKTGFTQAAATCEFPANLQGRSLMSVAEDDFHCTVGLYYIKKISEVTFDYFLSHGKDFRYKLSPFLISPFYYFQLESTFSTGVIGLKAKN